MIIDAHAHACGEFLTIDSILKVLDDTGVSKVVLTAGQLDSTKTYNLPDIAKWFPHRDVIYAVNAFTKRMITITRAAEKLDVRNAYVNTLTRLCPDRILQFYWADPRREDITVELDEKYEAWRFKGIKLQQCWERFEINSAGFHRLAEWAGNIDIPVFVHAASKKDILELIDFLKDHPRTMFIMGHLLGMELLQDWAGRLPNFVFEISTPQLVSEVRLKKAIHAFGANRIVLGSDTPYGKDNLAQNIRRVQGLPISYKEKEAILGENMRRILRIS